MRPQILKNLEGTLLMSRAPNPKKRTLAHPAQHLWKRGDRLNS